MASRFGLPFPEGDHYDRDVVLRSLVQSVERFRGEGRAPELIFATGDIAHSGSSDEYQIATRFFDDLLAAAGLERRHLFVVPGNHDVDRTRAAGLARTLESREEADDYFNPSGPWYHQSKQWAFREWYNRFFDGIRSFAEKSTCGPVEAMDLPAGRVGVLPINSALFSLDDNDHEKLWVGRRCLDAALRGLKELDAQVNIVLLHHPLDWLHGYERPNIKNVLQASADFVLRGHCHELEVEGITAPSGTAIHLAAGAAYQTRKWPNRAFYCDLDGDQVRVFPIRYEDHPREVWTVDPSLFPEEPAYEKTFSLQRLAAPPGTAEGHERAARCETPSVSVPFKSNVPTRLNRPFVGRDTLLEDIRKLLADTSRERIVVLEGPPGVGKSELAREFARQHLSNYPGGTFLINFGTGLPPLDLAVIGKNILHLDCPADLPLADQCLQTLLSLGPAPTLLIFDNAQPEADVARWLPPAGMPCHVLVTTVLERWAPGWPLMKVNPLSRPESLRLVEELAGTQVAKEYGDELVRLSGGLPAARARRLWPTSTAGAGWTERVSR